MSHELIDFLVRLIVGAWTAAVLATAVILWVTRND